MCPGRKPPQPYFNSGRGYRRASMFKICQHNTGLLHWVFMHAFLINLNFNSFIKSAAQITKGNKHTGAGETIKHSS